MSCRESRGAIRPAERAIGAGPASAAFAQTTSMSVFCKLIGKVGWRKTGEEGDVDSVRGVSGSLD